MPSQLINTLVLTKVICSQTIKAVTVFFIFTCIDRIEQFNSLTILITLLVKKYSFNLYNIGLEQNLKRRCVKQRLSNKLN